MHVLGHRFAKDHDFEKPNDIKALALMDYAAQASTFLNARDAGVLVIELVSLLQQVLKEFGDIRMAFGESDEMSFVLNKASTLYGEACLVHSEAESLLQQEPLLQRRLAAWMTSGDRVCTIAV